jgi:hypothetical protein
MSFKNLTEHCHVGNFCPNGQDELPNDWESRGLTHDGFVTMIAKTEPQAKLVASMIESLPLLGLELKPTAFMTVSTKQAVISDGEHSYEIERRCTEISPLYHLSIKPMPKGAYYKCIYDPCSFSRTGLPLTPIARVFELVNKNMDVFADPFSTRNTGRRYANEVKTIRPGLRQQVRKRHAKRMAKQIVSVDEVTP